MVSRCSIVRSISSERSAGAPRWVSRTVPRMKKRPEASVYTVLPRESLTLTKPHTSEGSAPSKDVLGKDCFSRRNAAWASALLRYRHSGVAGAGATNAGRGIFSTAGGGKSITSLQTSVRRLALYVDRAFALYLVGVNRFKLQRLGLCEQHRNLATSVHRDDRHRGLGLLHVELS